jgi:hypothetical protein
MLCGERLDLEHGRRHPGHDGHGRRLGRPDGAPPGSGETRPKERLYHARAGEPLLWAGQAQQGEQITRNQKENSSGGCTPQCTNSFLAALAECLTLCLNVAIAQSQIDSSNNSNFQNFFGEPYSKS